MTRRESNKKYRDANKEKVLDQISKWRKSNPDNVKQYNKKSHMRRKLKADYIPKKRTSGAIYNAKLKSEVLCHYSPNGILGCSWDKCNVTDIDMLTLDHVLNNGSSDRVATGKSGGCSTYNYLRKNNFPEGFQTMCANHQLKKDLIKRRQLAGIDMTVLKWNWPPKI